LANSGQISLIFSISSKVLLKFIKLFFVLNSIDIFFADFFQTHIIHNDVNNVEIFIVFDFLIFSTSFCTDFS
jgi:hypothetical protein